MNDLVDTVAAALAVRVEPSTIRTWANRGKIEKRGKDRRGRSLYSLTDVRRVHSESAQASTSSERT